MTDPWIEWLRTGLEKPGKSQRELAERLGVFPSAVSKMIGGKRRIQATEIPIVAAYIGEPPPIGEPVALPRPEAAAVTRARAYLAEHGGPRMAEVVEGLIAEIERLEDVLERVREVVDG